MYEPRFLPFNPCLPAGIFKKPAPTVTRSIADALPNGQVVLTYSGTSALSLSARALKRIGVTRLIAPSFNCGHEIEPFQRLDFDISFYPIDQRGNCDFETLCSLMRGPNQVLLVTHFFGFPQPIERLQTLCREYRVWLIEDCAHSFLSQSDNRLMGSYGDIAVFSFRKTLPIPDGGAVVTRHPDLNPMLPSAKPKVLSVSKKAFRLALDRFFLIAEGRNAVAFNMLKKAKGALILAQTLFQSTFKSNNLHLFSPDDESYDFDDQILDWGMSSASEYLLRFFDFNALVAKRRENYRYVLGALKDLKRLTPMFTDLPAGICPLEFPLVPPFYRKSSDTVMADYPYLYKWWSHFHKSVPWDDFPESRWLKNNCRIIAIHQDMKRRHIDYLIDCAIDADKRI